MSLLPATFNQISSLIIKSETDILERQRESRKQKESNFHPTFAITIKTFFRFVRGKVGFKID